MALKKLLKFHKYAFAWENYLLLARAIRAALLARRSLAEKAASPHFTSSLNAVDQMYLPPQPGWKISTAEEGAEEGAEERADKAAEKIARFASFVVNFPVAWGRCVQQSLITYRLLNGYGIPAKICFGVSQEESSDAGHAWVIRLSDPEQALGEKSDPRDRFKLVYTSTLPQESA